MALNRLTRVTDFLISIKSTVTGVTRLLSEKLSDVVSLKDYGGVGDDATQNNAAVSTAAGKNTYVPTGVFRTSLDATGLGPFHGGGAVRTLDGNKRGKYFSSITSAPTSIGNEGSVITAFNGDNSKSHFQIEHRISGADTLGKPATGYVYQPETMPNYTYLYNASGWNESKVGNGGRTGTAAYRAKVDQYGQGDAVAFNASLFVAGTKADATHFLAQPAGVIVNGDMGAGADGVYFNPLEFIMHDNGYDAAAVGAVVNMSRTNPGGKQSAIWHGARFQSVGSTACDAVLSASGPWKNGIDFSQSSTDFGTNKAAMSLRAGQRIYLNNAANASGNTEAGWHSTVYNGDYISYDIDHITVAAGGAPVLQVSAGQVTALKRAKLFQSIDIVSSGNVVSGAGGIAQYWQVYVDGVERRIPLHFPS